MDWFKSVKGTVKKTAAIAYEKSAQLLEITKLSFRVSEEEAIIDNEFKKLGVMVYEEYKAGKELDESVKTACELIDAKYIEIENIKNEISVLKNVKVCEECGFANSIDNIYCAKCGKKLED